MFQWLLVGKVGDLREMKAADSLVGSPDNAPLVLLIGFSPLRSSPSVGLFLGIGLTMFQHPWEFAAGKLSPKLAESALSFYLVVAIVSYN
jgi:hypothetical protein